MEFPSKAKARNCQNVSFLENREKIPINPLLTNEANFTRTALILFAGMLDNFQRNCRVLCILHKLLNRYIALK